MESFYSRKSPWDGKEAHLLNAAGSTNFVARRLGMRRPAEQRLVVPFWFQAFFGPLVKNAAPIRRM
jgi:hypothetical protein